MRIYRTHLLAHGFSLPELTLLLWVLALLASYHYADKQEQVQQRSLQSVAMDLDYLTTSARRYRDTHGIWPDSIKQAQQSLGLAVHNTIDNRLGGNYIFDITTDSLKIQFDARDTKQATWFCTHLQNTACMNDTILHEVAGGVAIRGERFVSELNGAGASDIVDMGGHYINNIGSINSNTKGVFDFRIPDNLGGSTLTVFSVEATEIFAHHVYGVLSNDPMTVYQIGLEAARNKINSYVWSPNAIALFPPSRYPEGQEYIK